MTIDVQVVLAVLAQAAVVIGAITAGVIWLKKWIKAQVSEPLASVQTDVTAVQAEVTTNQGNSMKDAVDSTALAVGRTEGKLDALVRRFEDHLIIGHAGRPFDGG